MVQLSSGQQVERVIVVDVDMPISSIVSFMIKWAIAAIPALLLLALLGGFIAALLSALIVI